MLRTRSNSYIRHPKSLLPTSEKRGSDRILKHLVYPEICEHTRLIIGDAQLLSHSSRLVRHNQITFPRCTYKRTAIAEERQIRLITVHVAEIVLASDKDDGRLGTETT